MGPAEQKLIQLMGIPIESKTEPILGYNIHYVKTGQGPALILLHGINLGWGEWYKNIPELAKHFTVYAVDLPGAGQSSTIDFSKTKIDQIYTQIITGLITKLELPECHITGHSVGGWISLKLALNKQIKILKLVLVDSLGFSSYLVYKQRPLAFKSTTNFLAKTVMRPNRNNLKNFLTGVLNTPDSLPPELLDYYVENVATSPLRHPFFLIHQLLKPFSIKPEFTLTQELCNINSPTLILAGDNDPLLPWNKNQPNFSRIPHQKTLQIENCGHVPPLEKPDYFNQILTDFLNS